MPEPSALGTPRPGLGRSKVAGQPVYVQPAEGLGALGFACLADSGPSSLGTTRSGRRVLAHLLLRVWEAREGSPGAATLQGSFMPLSAGEWVVTGRGASSAPPARPRPPGVPSGGAVPRAQTHGAEALQRIPSAAQAGEAAPTDRPWPSSCPAPGGRQTSCGPHLCHPRYCPSPWGWEDSVPKH